MSYPAIPVACPRNQTFPSRRVRRGGRGFRCFAGTVVVSRGVIASGTYCDVDGPAGNDVGLDCEADGLCEATTAAAAVLVECNGKVARTDLAVPLPQVSHGDS